jgi:high affinity Mn2+ porin
VFGEVAITVDTLRPSRLSVTERSRAAEIMVAVYPTANVVGSLELWQFGGLAVMKILSISGALVALCVGDRAMAADVPAAMPTKASTTIYDWTGLYVGTHIGYATGSSDWSATPAGATGPSAAGSLDFFNSFEMFKGTGSYFAGLQAGYNYMFPSRLVVGVEADVSFPSIIGGSQMILSPSIGQESYAEAVELSGTVRGRIGYAFNDWLVYATGGFAWTYDQFTRTRLVGIPAGGTADPGTVEALLMVPRIGWTVGAGVEVALPSNWTARLEYLFTDYSSRGVTFPAGAQRFDSDLALQGIRLGLNYRIGADATKLGDVLADGPSALDTDRFSLHGQTTYLSQYAFPFRAPYHGQNSLDSNAGRETWDVTVFAGVRLWQGAELWINPEIDQGFGLSGTLGIAGFPSGEAYKIGTSVPYARLPRMFVRQTIDLGGDTQKLESGINQFGGSQTADRLVITLGKFGVADVFDTNKYAHDPRSDFMNWSLVDTGSFDYAADAWGYTYGAAVEWYQGPWTLRAGLFDLSTVPNSTDLDPQFGQLQWVGEIERRYDLWGQPGKVAVTGFLSRGRMGRFDDAVQLAALTGGPADIAAVRSYTSRGGVSVNLEQQISPDLGAFARAGVANGGVEPYEFTDIDRTVAAGLSLSGKPWGRPDDTLGIAGVVNGISAAHQAFLNAGGLGILVGDGQLPNPGCERIFETYYSFPLRSWKVTVDYQFIVNPGYNRDRGPVSVIGARLHAQF